MPKILKARRTYSVRSIRRANRRRKASSLEKDIYAILREEGIPFTREKTIGRCHADIFIEPFTVVELQGCYWHGCPKCYKTLSKMQKNAQAKDARRFYFFDKLGFDTQVIWECELEKNPAAVRAKLCNLYEKAA